MNKIFPSMNKAPSVIIDAIVPSAKSFSLDQSMIPYDTPNVVDNETHNKSTHASKLNQQMFTSKQETIRAIKQSNVFQSIPLFATLTNEQINHVLSKMKLRTFDANAAVVTQSEEMDTFFIITSGTCGIYLQRKHDKIRTHVLKPFDYYGLEVLTKPDGRTVNQNATMNADQWDNNENNVTNPGNPDNPDNPGNGMLMLQHNASVRTLEANTQIMFLNSDAFLNLIQLGVLKSHTEIKHEIKREIKQKKTEITRKSSLDSFPQHFINDLINGTSNNNDDRDKASFSTVQMSDLDVAGSKTAPSTNTTRTLSKKSNIQNRFSKIKQAAHVLHLHGDKEPKKSEATSIVALFAEDLTHVTDANKKKSCTYTLCKAIPVIPEDAPFMLGWDILLMGCLFWVMWAVPFQIGFAESDVPGRRVKEGFEWLITMDTIVDVFFWMDIIINFRVTYRERGTHKHVSEPYSLASHYLLGWFIPDMISVLPFAELLHVDTYNTTGEMQGISPSTLKLTRILRFLKMTKLIRLLKVGRLIFVLEDRVGCSPLLFSMGGLLATVFLVIHGLASVFYLCSHTLVDVDSTGYVNSWVFADDVSNTHDVWSMYIAAMYWSCTTITTVGYGDITPKSDGGRVFVFFAMILGAGMYGYIIAAMGNIVADMSVVSSIRRKRMMELSLFMDAKGLPSGLRSKIRESYRFWLERVDMFHEEKIMKALPQDLRETVAQHYARKIFSEPGFFANAHPQFVAEVLPMLRPVLFQPHSIILDQGDIAESMFIITKGILDVEVIVVVMEDGTTSSMNKFRRRSSAKCSVRGSPVKEQHDNKDKKEKQNRKHTFSLGKQNNDAAGQKKGRASFSKAPAIRSSSPVSQPLPPSTSTTTFYGTDIRNVNIPSLPTSSSSLLSSMPIVKQHEHHKKIATLLAGQIFGEMAILRPEQMLRRNATVKCRDHFCELFRIHREQVVDTWLSYPTVRAHLLGLTEQRAKTHYKEVKNAHVECTQEAQRYWKKITRAKSKHAMLRAKATIRLQKGLTVKNNRKKSLIKEEV